MSRRPQLSQGLRRALRLESLESRQLLATFTAMDAADSPIAVYSGPVASQFAGKIELSGTVNYKVGSPQVRLAPNALVSSGGSVLHVTAVNGRQGDIITIRNQGTGPGQIGYDGTNVTYQGVQIGTVNGGSFQTRMAVTFNGNATNAARQAVVRNVIFGAAGYDVRVIKFVFKNQSLTNVSNTATKLVNVVGDSGAQPVIGSFGGDVTFTPGGSPVRVESTATVSDADTPDFNRGSLVARIASNAGDNDRLIVQDINGITHENFDGIPFLQIGGQRVARIYTDAKNQTLVLALIDADATEVQTLLRAISFQNANPAMTTTSRNLSVYLNDGHGRASSFYTKQIDIGPDSILIPSVEPVRRFAVASLDSQPAQTPQATKEDDSTITSSLLLIRWSSEHPLTGFLATVGTGSASWRVSGERPREVRFEPADYEVLGPRIL
jgi:hypothetical protein